MCWATPGVALQCAEKQRPKHDKSEGLIPKAGHAKQELEAVNSLMTTGHPQVLLFFPSTELPLFALSQISNNRIRTDSVLGDSQEALTDSFS